MTILIVIGAALAGTILSLVGGMLLLSKRISREKIMLYAMPLAAGAFLGAAFLMVLPEALHMSAPEETHSSHEEASHEEAHHEEEHRDEEHAHSEAEEKHHDEHAHEENHEHEEAAAAAHADESGSSEGGLVSNIFFWTLLGFVLFFILERSIRWFHRHHEHAGDNSQKSLVVVGDTLHNAIDGVAIGAAFLINIPLGIATTIAVAAHEIPQEMADFGILISKGMKRKKALLINILSGLAAVATAVLTYSLGGTIEAAVPVLLAIVAGYFIYIAASDIIPDIHERAHKQANLQAALLIIGIVAIGVIAFLLENVLGLGHSH